MGEEEDKQLVQAAGDGKTREALRLIKQEGANVNCTDWVRRSGEAQRAPRGWGGKGKRRQRHIV